MRRSSIYLLITLLLFSTEISLLHAGVHRWAESSVLKEGNWIKIRIPSTGVYKLTYEELKQMGIQDPAKVHLYGYGGTILKEDFSLPMIDDLPEVSLHIEKGGSSTFGPGGFILFYAKGAVSFEATSNSPLFSRTQNPYATFGHYFLTESDAPMNQMATRETTNEFDTEVDWFNDYLLHEKELASVAQTGREMFGENFGYTLSQSFTFNAKGILPQPTTLGYGFIAKASERTELKIEIDGQNKVSYMDVSSVDNIFEKAKRIQSSIVWTATGSENLSTKVTYGKSGHTNARLDYLLLNYTRALKLYDAYTLFRTSAPELREKKIKYNIGETNERSLIWDLTAVHKPIYIKGVFAGGKSSFVGESIYAPQLLTEYAVVNPQGNFPKPEVVGKVKAQNLHALPQTDFVIIVSPDLKEQAETLAAMHREMDNLHVTVVEPEVIYNEFSSGTPDATAYRRFLKMFYDRATNESERPKYLLLFGDGAFDNRFLQSEWTETQKKNYLLTYQSNNSLNERNSYVSDDYYGFLDDHDGILPERDSVDIGIGRLPVTSKSEAIDAVNKILGYVSNKDVGSWKNQIAFLADDGDGNLHATQANELAQSVDATQKDFVVNKIYLDAFKKESGGAGARYPDVNKLLMEKMQSGLLLLDYVGHGSIRHWATEQVMTEEMINSMRNTRLPLWVTATCDFSRFDYYSTTSGEQAFLNGKGGAIALFTTTRVVESGPNHTINKEFIKNVFANKDGKRYRLGDIMKLTKRALGYDFNKMNFTLLGDPAIKLNYPEYKTYIDSINGKPITGAPDTLKALQKISLAGSVHAPDGALATEFKGSIRLTVYDCEEEYTTRDNDNTGRPFKYKDRLKVLYVGQSNIDNGRFTTHFTVPKDISYSNLQGRINMYAVDEHGNEAQGHFDNYVVGGTDPNEEPDEEGPTIHFVGLNSPSFVSGDRVNETPVLLVDVEDKSGINVSGNAIGHDIVAIVDASTQTTYVLNSYFEPDADNPGRGTVEFKIPQLSAGRHTLFFRVWDAVGNSSSSTIEFEVEEGMKPQIHTLFVDKNPAQDNVNFYIKHDRPSTLLNVRIEVYSVSGILVWSHYDQSISNGSTTAPIQWNLTAGNGQPLPAGVYLYRALISTNEGQEATQTKKLIIKHR